MEMTHIVLATAFVLPLCVPSPATVQPGALEQEQALFEFHQGVREYAELHRRLEGPLPPLTSTNRPLDNYLARQVLASAIRRARAAAGQGNLFTPDVSLVFRTIIADALSGRDVKALLADLSAEGSHSHVLPAINEPLPLGTTHEVPCVLLQILPALPEDMEYRIAGRHLVLWDIHANLVIDLLPDAFTVTPMTDSL